MKPMNPLQVNFAVDDLAAGIRFYSAMFASAPAMLKPDCAKWTLNAPSVSFTIFISETSRCATPSGLGWLLPRARRPSCRLEMLEAGCQ
jgi:hypothetical protein